MVVFFVFTPENDNARGKKKAMSINEKRMKMKKKGIYSKSHPYE